ncbi:MAG: glycosyltransferase family 39 protein [Chloroflexi bacterium]|nr:glycosyltransferase family 39 protein [Chloroflexota bacterium]
MMQKEERAWIYNILLLAVLMVAAYLRFTGSDWGMLEHQHPDELFLTSVTYDIAPIGTSTDVLGSAPTAAANPWRATYPTIYTDCKEWGGYFDTACSPLNPHNRGHSFYTYGTLPLILVRYSADWITQLAHVEQLSTWVKPVTDLKQFGRQWSALADLLTVLLLYLIVVRLYNRKTALLAAAFSALAVMQIQQSHFYTTDNFSTLFMFLAILFAVEILVYRRPEGADEEPFILSAWTSIFRDPLFWFTVAFGVAFGMAVASKLTAAPLALLLPAAFFMRSLRHADDDSVTPDKPDLTKFWVYMIIGGFFALLSFRVFQPYAFHGIISPNMAWFDNVREQRAQATPDSDLPWNLQWARRSHLYSFENLTIWGLGLPLGILSWLGFLWMAWRIFKNREWRPHLLLWGWTALYFGWQSMQYNPTMRYQLPIYPLLAMMAAWFVFEGFQKFVRNETSLDRNVYFYLNHVVRVLGAVVLVLTAAWAFAFLNIYTHDETRIAASKWIFQNVPAPINARIGTADGGIYSQPMPFSGGQITLEIPYSTVLVPNRSGELKEILLGHVADLANSGIQTLTVTVSSQSAPEITATATVKDEFRLWPDSRGGPVTLTLTKPLPLTAGEAYNVTVTTSGGSIVLTGSSVINETDYDFTLPFRVEYDPFGGLYRGDLNLQVYWDDNTDKLVRLVDSLNQGDYIFIPTNHQYGQITRLPERFPLTTEYYRQLIGCPAGEDIIHCYRVAEPGMYQGNLGYDLVAVFTSYPTLGPISINDQAAEEAFTFYDHPKVLIFKKSANYDPTKVQAILGAVDLTRAVHLTPRQANSYQYKDLMLPPDTLKQQQAGGTWSQLFSYDALQNRYPILGLLFWYLFIFALGVVTYPLARLALPGLGVNAYALSRILGLTLLAYFSWLAGSIGLTYSRLTIGLVLAGLTAAGLGVGWMKRGQLLEEWRTHRRFFLTVELIFFGFFLFDLLVRLGNPDLWHPAKGGERPMDFSYFNAVLKSSSFPAYDPWYAGGYINYYYYGFVLVGTPVKWLGIVPSIAYNLILPTLFALVAVGAFAVVYSLLQGTLKPSVDEDERPLNLPLVAGLAASMMTVALGNLGTIRMIYQGFQRMAAPGGIIDNANIVQRMIWAAQGFFNSLTGGILPFGRGDWYWNPSRVMPPDDMAITEFPLFTFLYSDLHAHMIVLSLALFVLAWAVSLIKTRAKMSRLEWLASFFVGGLMVGAIYPTNLSDIYTYLLLAVIVFAYVLWFHVGEVRISWLPEWIPALLRRIGVIVVGVAALVGLSYLLYEPYRYWYAQSYGSIIPWTGQHTPVWSYLTHWGLFLFIIFFWLVWETREWMAATPVSALGRLRPYALLIEGLLAVFLAALVYLLFKGVQIAWLALPMAAWAGLLLLRPGQSDEKRLILFLIGTALVITLVVEVVVAVGDIGRMNTVFKFYLQAWLMLAVSAAAALGWLLAEVGRWRPGWRGFFQGGLVALFAGAFLFTFTATADKISDRMNPLAPHTLDSMDYMKSAVYSEFGRDMDLSQDYRAIRWLQDNVQGSPVIVEAAPAGVQYTWLSRMTIYTGLPGVVGWQWHQQQQRVQFSQQVIDRGVEVDAFYNTPDPDAAQAFLRKYNVRYIIVGQLERGKYASVDPSLPNGLQKFEDMNGVLWQEVYRDGETVIYQVLP